jgi:hypothetical protein
LPNTQLRPGGLGRTWTILCVPHGIVECSWCNALRPPGRLPQSLRPKACQQRPCAIGATAAIAHKRTDRMRRAPTRMGLCPGRSKLRRIGTPLCGRGIDTYNHHRPHAELRGQTPSPPKCCVPVVIWLKQFETLSKAE